MYSRTRTFGAKYTNRILESQDGTPKNKIINYIETQILFKRFAYQVQSDYITVL